jgi:DNA phosphorothioation-dependent restriction protein DptG
LALEQVEAEYLKRIKLIETERDELKQCLKVKQNEYTMAEKMLKESVLTQKEQQLTINQLSTQFDNQHKIMDTIKSTILLNTTTTTSKFTNMFTLIAWIFFIYHMMIFLFTTLFFGSLNILLETPRSYLFKSIYDWINMR